MTIEAHLQALTEAVKANTAALLSMQGGGGAAPAFAPPAAPAAPAAAIPGTGGAPVAGFQPSTASAVAQMTPDRAMQFMSEQFQALSGKYQHDAAAAPVLGSRILEISRAFGVTRVSEIPEHNRVAAALAIERLVVADANGGIQALQTVDLGLAQPGAAPAAGGAISAQTGNPM